MATRKTKVIIEAEAKGFEKTKRVARQTFDAMNPEKLEKGYSSLRSEIVDLAKTMGSAFGGMAKEIENLTRAVEKLTEKKKKLDDDDDDRKRKNRRGFAMGVMQGAGFGEYFPDKGFRANVAGRMIGQSGRATAGAFTGLSGFTNAFAGQPIVGAILGAVLNPAIQAAQSGIQLAGLRMQAAQGMTPGGLLPQPANMIGDIEGGWESAKTLPHIQADIQRRGEAAARGRYEMASGSVIGALRAQGTRFGMSETEATAFSQQLLSTAGMGREVLTQGGGAELARAMAASQSVGLSAQAAGAFMRTANQGAIPGLVGGEGLVDAIEKGFKLGLRGSDLTNYMQQTAQGIMQFEQNGLPVNTESLLSLGNTLQAQGLAGMRGVNVARGLLDAGRGMSVTGPTNAAQFLMLRDVYGYEGGGLEDMYEAMRKASMGDATGAGVNKLVQTITGGRRDAAAKLGLLQYFNQLGVQVGIPDIENFFSDNAQARAQAQANMGAAFDESLLFKDAAGKVSGIKARQAIIENTRADVGMDMAGVVQTMEMVSLDLAKGAAVFSKDMKEFATWIREQTSGLPGAMVEFKEFLDKIKAMFGSDDG